ncbi:hypothetical protein [Mesorhizobium sp. NPDC059025]|uniref:hypothetical protein n=1 Tax=unclassified Mesorhizobium TaxID=325217 RepID=UPI003676135F
MNASVRASDIASNYLDLCPTVFVGPSGYDCYAPHNWNRAEKLRAQYGEWVVAVETLHQFAVRATSRLFASNLNSGNRFIPASIRQAKIDRLAQVRLLVGSVTKNDAFFSVTIKTVETSGIEVGGDGAVIYVVQAPWRLPC